MKTTWITAGLLGLGVMFATITGCETSSPGVKNYVGTYTANVDARPDKVTNAARKAVEELKLTNVTSTATKIDGRVRAWTAQNEEVQINVEQAGDNVSKISIRVGASGDEAVSKQILDRTKSNLHWF